MIKNLTLKNFRNFSQEKFFFSEKKNIIIGNNGYGKTNILQAISLFSGNIISNINYDNLVQKDKDLFYIEIETEKDSFSISYDKEKKSKNFFINKKKVAKTKINQNFPKIVFFTPISMNMMYLSPNLRRDFLDNILIQSFQEYDKLFKEYKKILISRNKLLKNIKENKSNKKELDFWNKNFAKKASFLYNYRFGLINFLQDNLKNFTDFFIGKIKEIKINYKTKIDFLESLEKKEQINFIENQILNYLEKNKSRDIILGTTQIGPHIDDFEIIIDNNNLIEFASRGEVKSIILGLKILEIKFIEKFTKSKPILLIDDLLSELDIEHKNILLSKINNYQTFITSIKNEYKNDENIIILENNK